MVGLDRFYHGVVSELSRLSVLPFGVWFSGISRAWIQRANIGGRRSCADTSASGVFGRRPLLILLPRPGRAIIATHFAFLCVSHTGSAPKASARRSFSGALERGVGDGGSVAVGRFCQTTGGTGRVWNRPKDHRSLIGVQGVARHKVCHPLRRKSRSSPVRIDTDAFSPSCSRAEVRARLGWPTDRPIVALRVRRLVQRMGLEQLVHAMEAAFAAVRPDAHAHDRRKSDRPVPASRSRLLGSAFPIRFGCSALSRTQICRWPIAPPIFPSSPVRPWRDLVSSLWNPLAAGTPVLVTPVGGLPETVRNLEKDLILSLECPPTTLLKE